MKNIQLITYLCFFSIFTIHTNDHINSKRENKIIELTDKIAQAEINKTFFKPGLTIKVVMYGTAAIAVLYFSLAAREQYSYSQQENNFLNCLSSLARKEAYDRQAISFTSISIITAIMKSSLYSAYNLASIQKSAYEKQLETISKKQDL